jgi:hypothetical protein
MTEVLDKKRIQRAMKRAAEALAQGDPDTLAGRFNPGPIQVRGKHDEQPPEPRLVRRSTK